MPDRDVRGVDIDELLARREVVDAPLTDVARFNLALEGLGYDHHGAIAVTNTAAEVLGSPLNFLAWLANDMGRATDTRLGSVAARFV